ncbi:MAG: flavodoxin-dependent (E)-4-hydroxy-3-methylbut-2-enyl-diphosphate synthase [Ruminococcaceae bacterium]|nr:flavodoxin-dependent (E)-4-hydroxy-3-methylbut-2-enyl-diphosphate synthase [Oscillospiraceae bacterium]
MKISIGNIKIGQGEKIAIQSMTNVIASDTEKTIRQINELAAAGCDIVRFAVPDEECAKAVSTIKEKTNIPLVADIHFDYRLALMCIERGIDKVRINPGNIGGEDRAKAVLLAAKEKGIPVRVGVNGGSLEKEILKKYGGITPEGMVESALTHIRLMEKYDFTDIVVSIKSSDVKKTIAAYRLARETFDYPLHLGVTEAGTYTGGLVKSSIGIGSLLADGIGETIRVSLTDDPIREVEAAKMILSALDLGEKTVKVVSCPTCGRTKIDLIKIANEVTEAVKNIKKDITVAVMGCVVNGPGEAKDADIGIAGGDGCAMLFKKGEIIGKIHENQVTKTLLSEIEKM